jgi:hypothetical protein
MKRICSLLFLMITILLVDCKKDKKDTPAEPDNGLLAVYTMNGELKDSTGNIPKTEYSKGIKATSDRKGNPNSAMYFDAGKMWANVDNWAADSITITCWVRSAGPPNNGYFVLSDENAFGLYAFNGEMGLVITNPVANAALADYGPGWIHLAGTYDGKNIRTYINGQIKEIKSHPGQPEHTQKIEVGVLNNWNGSLDDLRFYNRVLSEDEIVALATY